MSGIFISYRRQDSQGATGRLADGLEYAFGKQAIFRDVLTITPGADFVTAIETALRSCVVLLAIIGPRWLAIQDNDGKRRIDDSKDFTRREVEIALAQGILVIPVLVDGAQMPGEADLPDGLKPLAHRQAHELTDKRWDYDTGQLIEQLAKVDGLPSPRLEPRTAPGTRMLPAVLAAMAIATVGLLYAAQPLARWAGVEEVIPNGLRDFINDRAQDGGTVLVVLVLLIFLVAFLDQQRLAVSAVLGDPSNAARVVAVVAGCLLGFAVLTRRGMFVSAGVLAALVVAYIAAKRVAPDLFGTVARASASAAVSFVVLAAAMTGDVAIQRARTSAFEVMFVMPPNGDSTDRSEQLFRAVKKAFNVSFKNVDRIKIVPDKVSRTEFLRYAGGEKLPGYDNRYGYPRIFIRSRYDLDSQSKSLSFLITPERAEEGGKKTSRVSGWSHDAWAGLLSDKEISMAALQATFEVMSFLSANGLIRLTPVEQRTFWNNFFAEYGEQLLLVQGDCAEKNKVKRWLSGSAPADEHSIRELLSASCGRTDPEAAKSGSTSEIATAAAVITAVAR